MKITQILINKTVYLSLSLLELRTTVKYEFCYDYVKPKYWKKAKSYYMGTESFIVYINTEDIYVNIAKDAEAKLYTSNYDLDKPLPKGKYKKAIGLMKNKLCGK